MVNKQDENICGSAKDKVGPCLNGTYYIKSELKSRTCEEGRLHRIEIDCIHSKPK